MLPVACTRQIRLPLAAAFVVSTIFCAATTASAQTTAAKVQRYTEFTDESAAMRAVFGVAEPTSIKGHDIEIGAVSANGEVVAGTFNTSKCVVSGYEIFLWSKTGGVKRHRPLFVAGR